MSHSRREFNAFFILLILPLISQAHLLNLTLNSDKTPVVMGALSGTIFNDPDAMLDNTVDGSGIDVIDGMQLYAILYDNDISIVLDTFPIASDGTYLFDDLTSYGDYGVAISITNGVIGNVLPEIELPTDWFYTGDKLGTGTGSDGSPDGDQFGLSVGSTELSNVNFGIQKRPSSDGYTFGIADPVPNSLFEIGSGETESLSGDDFEDGLLGTGDIFGITSLPTSGNEIYYNSTQITLGDNGTTPPSKSNPFMITNYNPTLLEIKFTGGAQSSTSFKYVTYDAANIQSAESTYKLTYSALPVEWAAFEVKKTGASAEIYFATESEINSSHFLVQKSLDGMNFRNIHTFEGQGNSSSFTQYVYNDPMLSLGINYYRIVQLDLDGTVDYSEIKTVTFDADLKTLIYPNPTQAGKTINLKYYSIEEVEVIVISNMLGHEINKISFERPVGWNITSLDVSKLPVGMYSLRIGNRSQVKIFNITE